MIKTGPPVTLHTMWVQGIYDYYPQFIQRMKAEPERIFLLSKGAFQKDETKYRAPFVAAINDFLKKK